MLNERVTCYDGIWNGALPRVVIGSMKAQVENISFEKTTHRSPVCLIQLLDTLHSVLNEGLLRLMRWADVGNDETI